MFGRRDQASDDDSRENEPLVACKCREEVNHYQRRASNELLGIAFSLFTKSQSTHPSVNTRSLAALCHTIYSHGLATDMTDCHRIMHMLEDSGLITYADDGETRRRPAATLCCQRPMTQMFVFSDAVVSFQGNYESSIAKMRESLQGDYEIDSPTEIDVDDRLLYNDSIVLLTCGRYVSLRRSRSVCHYWETIILCLVGALSWFSILGMGIAGVLFAWWRNFGRRRAYLVLSGDGDEENPEIYNGEVFTIVPVRPDENAGPQYGEFVSLRNASTGLGIHAPQDKLLQMGGDMVVRITAEGKSGDIHFGDHVFIVTKSGDGLGWRTRKGHLDRTHYLCTDAQSKVVFTLKRSKTTCEDETLIGNSALLRSPRRNKVHISFIVYNVWMMPAVVTAFTQRFLKISLRKKTRARIIPDVLPPVDIVILSEAFCHSATAILARGFKAIGYKFETPPLQGHRKKSERKALNGGVVIYSRFPIEWCKMVGFENLASGDDAMADKGVIYVKIRKQQCAVHIFATHTQAWDTVAAKEVRGKQFQMIRELIDSLNIPEWEPVVIAGDLNVDRYESQEEYKQMLDVLDAEDSFQIQNPKTYSFDAVNNKLASGGPSSDGNCGLLDYIFTSRRHLKPSMANVEVFPVKSPLMYSFQKESYNDLSDHYPIIGQFTFDAPPTTTLDADAVSTSNLLTDL